MKIQIIIVNSINDTAKNDIQSSNLAQNSNSNFDNQHSKFLSTTSNTACIQGNYQMTNRAAPSVIHKLIEKRSSDNNLSATAAPQNSMPGLQISNTDNKKIQQNQVPQITHAFNPPMMSADSVAAPNNSIQNTPSTVAIQQVPITAQRQPQVPLQPQNTPSTATIQQVPVMVQMQPQISPQPQNDDTLNFLSQIPPEQLRNMIYSMHRTPTRPVN